MAEMLQNEVRESVLTEKDIKKAYMRWYNCCEISNSYERMQTVSFCYAISSVLKKLYPKKEEYVAALQRHLNFFNSQGIWGSSLLGVAMALEEEKAIGKDISDETIINVKTGLMGPMAGIGDTIDFIGSGVGDAIWNAMLKWLYEIIYGAIADFFKMMGNMGSEVFDLEWVQATVKLFTLFGWGLFVAGTVVAVFDVAIEYQCGRANIKTTALNILKGFFACSLIGIVPIELYKFCISLQNTFSHDLVGIASGGINESLADAGLAALAGMFSSAVSATYGLLNLLCMIAFAYCVIKMFFANIKRGGILLIQIAVGSLYMFSVPRGYADGFNQWCKQVIAICLTAFMQTTLLFLGLLTFSGNMLLGLGIMLAANEVPRIAQQFGLDSSVRVNMMSVVHATTTAVNLTRSVAKAAGK